MLKKLITLIITIAIFTPSVYSRKILKTEKNGFKWYMETYTDCSVEHQRAFSADNKLLIQGGVGDEIIFICSSENDPGIFLFLDREHGEHKLKLYTPEGLYVNEISYNFILPNEIIRFYDGNSYFCIVKDFKDRKDLYAIINDRGEIAIPFSDNILETNLYNSDMQLKGILKFGGYDKGWGIISTTGKIIVPIESKRNIWDEHGFIHCTGNTHYLLDNNGNILINGAKSISKVDKGFAVEHKDGSWGLYSKKCKWIIRPELGFNHFQSIDAYKNKNLYYVRDRKSQSYGVIDEDGNEILPCEFEALEYIGGNYFKFYSGGAWGVINDNSKVIIPTSRGYTSIGKYSTIQKTIPFTKPGYRGECNSRGIQTSLRKDNANSSNLSSQSATNTNTNTVKFPKSNVKYPIQIVETDHQIKLSGDNYFIISGNLIKFHFANMPDFSFTKLSPFLPISDFVDCYTCDIKGETLFGEIKKGKLMIFPDGNTAEISIANMDNPSKYIIKIQ